MTDKAVILAAGRGSRMRRAQQGTALNDQQAKIARSGVKSMIPVGRPFIDYLLSGLVDAGYHRVCLVVGRGYEVLRAHCRELNRSEVEIQFAIQSSPLGTANAVLSAREFAGDDAFLLVNSDNYYPQSALQQLRQLQGSAVAAFKPTGLLRGNITAARLQNYALISVNGHGYLREIVEKPDAQHMAASDGPDLINMNCWRFAPSIFAACEAISLSARNEYELPDAVSYAIEKQGDAFQVIEIDEPVLDLSTQADIVEVTRRLSDVEIHL